MPAKSYERQDRETDRAWQAFQIYLSLGTSRTPGKTAKQLGVSRPTVNRWLYSFDWKSRAEAYDQDNSHDNVFLSTPEASSVESEATPTTPEASPVNKVGKRASLIGNPWDRQPGEGDEAWVAFVIYRDLGADRTLKRVREELGKSDTMVERWSSTHQWVYRSAEWDKHLDQELQKATIKEKIDYVKLREQNLIKQEQLRAELLEVHLKRLTDFKDNPKANPYRLPSILTISESGKIDQESRSAISTDDGDNWAEIGAFRAMIRDELKERNNETSTPEETIE